VEGLKMYDNTDRGVLFKNSQKKTEKHPDYQGTVNVGGTEYRLAAWLKTSKNGDRYMSLAVSKEQQEAPARKAEAPAGAFEDDVPFAPYGKWHI
jgi:uncharacterized protein (DUF736 family)